MTETCVNCRFWLVEKDDASWGQCRRNAPSPFAWIDPDIVHQYQDRELNPCCFTDWPGVSYEDWCGQHEILEEPSE